MPTTGLLGTACLPASAPSFRKTTITSNVSSAKETLLSKVSFAQKADNEANEAEDSDELVT